MCIIIAREPKFEMPQDKLEWAITNNPHGYGLAYPVGDNRLEVIRSDKEPSLEKLTSYMDFDLEDENVLLHLRYTTKGATNLRNAHPFPVLERGKDGIDIRMAHNGTINNYAPQGTDTSSDTRIFVKEFVRPLFKRMSKILEPEEILQDEMSKTILENMIPNRSVLTFIDGQGQFMYINPTGNGGKKEDGWYYSNVYSFDPEHREDTSYTYGGSYRNGNFTQTTTETSSQTKSTQQTSTYTGGKSSTKLQLFSQKHDLEQSELTLLSDDMIDSLVLEEPHDTTLLIKELILMNKMLEDENHQKNKTIQSLKEKMQ